MLNKLLLILAIITISYTVSAIYTPVSQPTAVRFSEPESQSYNAPSVQKDVSIARTVIKKGALIEAVSLVSTQTKISDNSSSLGNDRQLVATKLEMLQDENATMEADLLMGYRPADEFAKQRLLDELNIANRYVSAKDREPQEFAVVDDGELTVPATDEMQTAELLPSAKMTD